MRDDFVAQAAQLDQLSRKQKDLESQAKTIALNHNKARAQLEKQRSRLIREKHTVFLQTNKQYKVWVFNIAWSIGIWAGSVRNILIVAALHWFLFAGLFVAGLRAIASGQCEKNTTCWMVLKVLVR